MTARELDLLITVVCEHSVLKGSVLAQIEFVTSTVAQASVHKDRLLASGTAEELEAAGRQFEFLSTVVGKLPQQLEELEARIAEGRAAITAALRLLEGAAPGES
jgi:hypothetical protein